MDQKEELNTEDAKGLREEEEREQHHLQVPAKFLEYFQTGKPIFAVAEPAF